MKSKCHLLRLWRKTSIKTALLIKIKNRKRFIAYVGKFFKRFKSESMPQYIMWIPPTKWHFSLKNNYAEKVAWANQVSLYPFMLPGKGQMSFLLRTRKISQTDWWSPGPGKLIFFFLNKTILNKRMDIGLLFRAERLFLRFFFIS